MFGRHFLAQFTHDTLAPTNTPTGHPADQGFSEPGRSWPDTAWAGGRVLNVPGTPRCRSPGWLLLYPYPNRTMKNREDKAIVPVVLWPYRSPVLRGGGWLIVSCYEVLPRTKVCSRSSAYHSPCRPETTTRRPGSTDVTGVSPTALLAPVTWQVVGATSGCSG